jgi:hypothetical protein
MTPLDVLAFTICATAVAVAVESVAARRRRKILRKLAAEWRMTYSRFDSLRLTPKVARSFPIPGAANLLVTDVIYGIEHERYRYVFRAEFTLGTVRSKKRLARVATFSEPRDRHKPQGTAPVVLAPDEGSLVEQYRHLAPGLASRATKAAAPPAAPAVPTAPVVAPSAGPGAEQPARP